jgi:creatinine amidohydrolase
MSAAAVVPLCIADDATFWPWHRWPEFSRWPDAAGTIVILPLTGMADWGLGHGLDAAETVLMHVLRAASGQRPPGLSLLVVPPLRFTLGLDSSCAFTVDPPLAHELIAEVVSSIAAAGFRRLVFYNASPWNEELIAASARDLRIVHGLQIFRISLSGLGLDFHPVRSQDRRKVQTLITALTEHLPEPPPPGGARPDPAWGDEAGHPLAEPAVPLAAARREGAATLTAAAGHLVSLLAEIHACPMLANSGEIPTARL